MSAPFLKGINAFVLKIVNLGFCCSLPVDKGIGGPSKNISAKSLLSTITFTVLGIVNFFRIGNFCHQTRPDQSPSFIILLEILPTRRLNSHLIRKGFVALNVLTIISTSMSAYCLGYSVAATFMLFSGS